MQSMRAAIRRATCLAFVFGLGMAPTMAGAEPLSLTLDWTPFGVHAPVFLAAQKGWLKDAGLDVSIRDGKGSTSTLQILAAGTTDVGFVQLASMVAAIEQGLTVTSIAGFVRAGDNGFVVPIDSPIKEPKDFIGKRIAFPLGGSSSALMDAFWRSVGLTRGQMTLIGVDSSAIASTYIAGAADAAVSPVTSLLPIVQGQRPSRAIPYAQFGLRVPAYGLSVRVDEVASRTADLGKLVQVLSRAWQYVADGHVDEGVDAIIQQRPNEKLDRAIMIAQIRETLKLVMTPTTEGKPIGWQSEEDWRSALTVLKNAGVIKTERPLSAYYTKQFFSEK